MGKVKKVIVVGGGPAGSMAAIRLASLGHHVHLFERDSGLHHKVCGEYLSAEGERLLRSIGLAVERLGACKIQTLRIFAGGVSYRMRLPETGFSISRGVLDQELRRMAVEKGVQLCESTVLRLGSNGVRIADRDAEVSAEAIILATGKIDLQEVPERVGLDSRFVGAKLHLQISPKAQERLREEICLYRFADGYGGMSLIEDGHLNISLTIKKTALKTRRLLWPLWRDHIIQHNLHLRPILADALPVQARFLTTPSIPYGFVRSQAIADNVYCVGDQLAVVASLTGDGISQALVSGRVAADAVANGQTSQQYHALVAPPLRRQVGISTALQYLFVSGLGGPVLRLFNLFPQVAPRLYDWTRVPLPLQIGP